MGYYFKCSKSVKIRKNLEASYITLWKSDLNEQKNFERLVLFKNRAIIEIIETP